MTVMPLQCANTRSPQFQTFDYLFPHLPNQEDFQKAGCTRTYFRCLFSVQIKDL